MSSANGDRPEVPTALTAPEVQSLIAEARKSVHDEILTKFARWVVAGSVILLGLAALGAWVVIKPWIKDAVGGVPNGAVVAFDLAYGCPPNWKPFTTASGRTIIGARRSSTEKDDGIIKDRDIKQRGGRARIKLQTKDLPPFSLSFSYETILEVGDKPAPVVRGISSSGGHNSVTLTFPASGQQSIDMAMPYVALFYCRKDGA